MYVCHTYCIIQSVCHTVPDDIRYRYTEPDIIYKTRLYTEPDIIYNVYYILL